MSDIIAAVGSSKFEVIFDLVVRMYCKSMRFKCNVHFIHVASNWMISQVIEGLSRGDMYEGKMKGGTMLSFLQL